MRRYPGEIVDPHQHFWTPEEGRHPWLRPEARIPFRYGDYDALKRRYLPDDYARDTQGWNVVASVYVEAEWDPTDPLGETRWVEALASRTGWPGAMVAQAWLHRADAAETLARQAAFPRVRSVRHKPGGEAVPGERTLMSDESWRRGYALLARHGLHFDLQTAWWNAPEIVRLARDFPDTQIVLNHTGLPSDRGEEALAGWHRAMVTLAALPNLAVKISGLGQKGRAWTAEANRWIVRETIAMFSPARAMFASNFPVDRLCASFDDIFAGFSEIVADFPETDQARLFAGTARAVYRLEPANRP